MKKRREVSPDDGKVERPVKQKGIVIEKGSGFRTKVGKDAQTPLARLLASQAPSSSDDDEESASEPTTSRKRKRADDDVVDISIMGAAGGKKTQAEVDEDAEIAWLEWKLGKGKGRGKEDEDEGDDGLDGELTFRSREV